MENDVSPFLKTSLVFGLLLLAAVGEMDENKIDAVEILKKPAASPYGICLHSRYVSGGGFASFNSGSASLSLEGNGRTLTTWGFHPTGLQVNSKYDGHVSTAVEREIAALFKERHRRSRPVVLQKKHCHAIAETDAKKTKALIESYVRKAGIWDEGSNNDVIFAQYIYSKITDENINLSQTQPMALYLYIEGREKFLNPLKFQEAEMLAMTQKRGIASLRPELPYKKKRRFKYAIVNKQPGKRLAANKTKNNQL